MAAVRVEYYSDILCIWAYVAERRVAELARSFGDAIEIEQRFCSVFPDARTKIEASWARRGGYEGFNAHLAEVAAKFPHIEVNDRLWLDVRPRSSASAHLFVKAVECLDGGNLPYLDRPAVRAAAALRRAFFAEARDVSDWRVQRDIAAELELDYAELRERIISSEAVAALAVDLNLAQQQAVSGSPTFIMNEGRQRLFGNVGYRLLEANVQELLRNPAEGEASWC